MADYKYVELVQGGIFNRGNIIEIPMSNMDLDYYGKEIVDGYHSVFLQSKEIVDYLQENENIVSYDGAVFSDCLYWDLDNDYLENARQDALELVDRLMMYDKSRIRVFFSGNKGFHILYVCNELNKYCGIPDFNQLVKSVCSKMAVGIKSFDRRIYDKTRLFRTTNSRHSKTGLYKIPLTHDELNSSCSEIVGLARSQRQEKIPEYTTSFNDDIVDILEGAIEGQTESTQRGLYSGNEIVDKILGGLAKGERNNGLASICGMFHSRNIDEDIIRAVAHSINNSSEAPLSDVEVDRIVSSVSRYPVKDEFLPVEDTDIVSMAEAGESWVDIFTKYGENSFGERFTHINKDTKMFIPGDVLAIVASSGVGKSTLGLELGNGEAFYQNGYSLFASLEMSRAGVFFRVATIESMPDESGIVPSSYVANRLINDSGFRQRVATAWNRVYIVDKGGISLEKIEQYFIKAQERMGGKFTNLVIDYAQNLENAEDVKYSMKMAREFKTLAKRLNTKIILLMQTNKACPDEYTELENSYIEGVGAYKQACDYIFGFWRSKTDRSRLHVKSLKTRWGDFGNKFGMVRHGLKYSTIDYTEDEETYL
jgi:hypothetical protein